MSQQDFFASLESELQLQGVAFSRAELQAFVAAAWPLIDDDPDVPFGAGEFLANGKILVT